MFYAIFCLYMKDISYSNGIYSTQIMHSLSMKSIFAFYVRSLFDFLLSISNWYDTISFIVNPPWWWAG